MSVYVGMRRFLIKKTELGYKTACAQMEIGSPSVSLRSISKCRLSIDGTEVVLGANEVPTIAEANLQAANGELDNTRKVFESARAFYDGINIKHREAGAKLEQLAKDPKQTQDNLDKARRKESDETLAANLTVAAMAVLAEDTACRVAADSLKACNPEQVRALADSTKGSLKTIKISHDSKDKGLIEVQTRLKIKGEEGLHEKLNAAKNQLEQLEFKNRATAHRANAVVPL